MPGYDPDFIGDGISIALPGIKDGLSGSVLRRPQLRSEMFSDHEHFTLVMNRHTRQLIYSAQNIDQTKYKEVPGSKGWGFDDPIGDENQLGNEYYKDRVLPSGHKDPNPYDRGHMVMRENNVWGNTDAAADDAGKATYIYANASLQHENLNQDEWKAIELKVVRHLQHDTNDRLSVFTGPIFGLLDRSVNLADDDSARVPSGFFKVICFRLEGGTGAEKLGVYAFAVFQDDTVLRDRKGSPTVKVNRNYQVTIRQLEELTNIDFGQALFDRNPLFYFPEGPDRAHVHGFPERIPLNGTSNLVFNPADPRCEVTDLAQRKLVITAAMVNPPGNDAAGEWVSLQNVGSEPVSVADWILVDPTSARPSSPGSLLPASRYVFKAMASGTSSSRTRVEA